MKNYFTLLTAAFLMIASSIIGQTTIEGVTLPATLTKEGKTLVLNGAGIREKYFIDIYVLGLYTQTKGAKAKDIVAADETMGFRLTIISSLVSKEKMAYAMEEGFDLSLNGKTKPLQNEINHILDIFKAQDIAVGDVFDIFYSPAKGVFATKNGKSLGVDIKGLEFKKALFGIWLGKEPVQYSLKDKITGKK